MSGDLPAGARRAGLQARCEMQRRELAEQMSGIEQRLQATDAVLGSVRSLLARPLVFVGGLALLLTARRSGWWALLSRGMVMLATARRVYQAFRK